MGSRDKRSATKVTCISLKILNEFTMDGNVLLYVENHLTWIYEGPGLDLLPFFSCFT